MTEVLKFTLANVSYPEPDFHLIAQSTKDISRLVFFKTDKMKAVQEKAQRVSGYALNLQTILSEELVTLSTKVQGLDFRELFGTLAEIDGELAKGTLSAGDRTELEGARDEQVGLFRNGLVDTIGKLRGAAGKVQGKAAEITGVVLAERTEGELKRRQDRQPQLIQAIAEKEKERKPLVDDRKKIIDAQDVIRKRNIADIAKDFIPKDLEKLDLKNLTQPEAEAIKQAIKLGVEVLTKLLGEVSEGFKYSDLSDQRKVLDGKIDKVDGDIKDLRDEQRENDDTIDDLSAVMDVEKKRGVLIGEVNKLPVAWSGFTDQLENLSGTQVTEASVTKLLGTIKSYVSNCLDARNRVIII